MAFSYLKYFSISGSTTFEKNLTSLVEVLKELRLERLAEGFSSFMLMAAQSRYCSSFSSRL